MKNQTLSFVLLAICASTAIGCSDTENSCDGTEINGQCIPKSSLENDEPSNNNTQTHSGCQTDSECIIEHASSTSCRITSGHGVCVINSCADGYQLDFTGMNCSVSSQPAYMEGKCQSDSDCQIANATSVTCIQSYDKPSYCYVDACEEGYSVNDSHSECEPLSCPQGYHIYMNECEKDDLENCGEHYNKCITPSNAAESATCEPDPEDTSKMICIIQQCRKGFHLIKGDGSRNYCEQDTNKHCGEERLECEKLPHVWTSTCKDGKCIAQECYDGFTVVNGQCVDDGTNECCGKNCVRCETNKGLTCKYNSSAKDNTCQNICDESQGEVFCGNNCTDINTDSMNCGKCGNVCKTDGIENAETMACVDKQCIVTACKNNLAPKENECKPCIIFTEDVIEEYALEHWDTNHDKCIGYEEADAVTEIPANAFKGKTDFSSIADLKQFKNLIKIGESAFEDCHIYDTIDLPNVKTIEKKAFMISSEGIVTLNLPNVEEIGESAFNSLNVKEIDLPKAKKIDSYAFANSSLEKINLPALTELGEGAFASCAKIEKISLPILETIPKSAFRSSGIKSISIPSVKTIGISAFEYCQSLNRIDFPNAENIQPYAFQHCILLSEVNLPKVTWIDSYAFLDTNLGNLELPEVIEVRGSSFESSHLTSISMPKLEKIGSYAFEYSAFKEVYLPNVTEIDHNAFGKNRVLTVANLPKAQRLGFSVFSGCSKLSEIVLSSKEEVKNMYISYSENEKAFWLNDDTETDELFSPANVTLTLNANKKSEVTNGNEWLGTTWKEIKFVEGN